METFDFPYHSPNDEYPGGSTIKFGRGYRFAARPLGPDEVIVHLNFPTMFFFQRYAGEPMLADVVPQLNIRALDEFYKRHRMFEPFNYPHPILGTVIVRFNKPLIMPKKSGSSPGEVGGYRAPDGTAYRVHQVDPFDIELLIQP
ncbi:hypothetical protein [Methylobacterium aquaticum]|uniref:Uncharacterized protein n=1 Tax=Methylobacterium aquaticum TaxID=270351 RepID=A0A0C6G2G4_9HYPH|nr:hypothetical protein [Methylobacterium aquaticum]BAQ50285.1 hypothetical protein Maq22A_3p50170 [Methylobacterium aquaticum]